MPNDPKGDKDRKISSYVLKPEFIPPLQDKMASLSKSMIPKNNRSKRNDIFFLMSHERHSVNTVSKLTIRH